MRSTQYTIAILLSLKEYIKLLYIYKTTNNINVDVISHILYMYSVIYTVMYDLRKH